MHVNLSNYTIMWDNDIKPGTKVCPSNGSGKVGVIVGVGPMVHHSWRGGGAPEYVKVLWGTGKKRGTIEEKDPDHLINYDKYFKVVETEYKRLKDMNEEVKTVGL